MDVLSEWELEPTVMESWLGEAFRDHFGWWFSKHGSRTAVATPPGNLLEMPYPRPSESKSLGAGTPICVLTSFPDDSGMCSGLWPSALGWSLQVLKGGSQAPGRSPCYLLSHRHLLCPLLPICSLLAFFSFSFNVFRIINKLITGYYITMATWQLAWKK